MHIDAQSFKLQKAGVGPEEYEDAFWMPKPRANTRFPYRAAVADGATDSLFSGIWAAMLVKAFGHGGMNASNLLEVLPKLQRHWLEHVSGKPLPWYAETKLQSGAFAALMCLTFDAPNSTGSGAWKAMAVGDSCVFQIRDGKLIQRFPLSTSEDFNNSPLLVSSVSLNNVRLPEAIRNEDGEWRAGDTFYLMTDALSCWFLRRWELERENDSPQDFLDLLGAIQQQEQFENLVKLEHGEAAADGRPMLRNDDQTLIRCSITG